MLLIDIMRMLIASGGAPESYWEMAFQCPPPVARRCLEALSGLGFRVSFEESPRYGMSASGIEVVPCLSGAISKGKFRRRIHTGPAVVADTGLLTRFLLIEPVHAISTSELKSIQAALKAEGAKDMSVLPTYPERPK
jgi:hypothetical protein